jgi:ubiquinone/menaquinone biosynthesis C-methylase UbiE
MPASPRLQTHPPRAGGSLRVRTAAVTATLAGIVSLVLLGHGVSWWYAPLAVTGMLLAHAAILGGLFLAVRVAGGKGDHGRAAGGQQDGAAAIEAGSDVLHRPRLFDWLVRATTLGQEGKLRRWMVDLADPRAGDAVLDIGCGTGTLLLTAAERVGPSGTLHGIEPGPEMAARARRKAESLGVLVDIAPGSADRLPYPAASFDTVYCTLMIHHLPPAMRDSAIREMRRVLRPGGRAVIVDWQRPGSLARALLSPMFLVYFLHTLRPGGSPLDGPEIDDLMQDLGFREVVRRSFGSGSGVGAVLGRVDPGSPLAEGPGA